MGLGGFLGRLTHAIGAGARSWGFGGVGSAAPVSTVVHPALCATCPGVVTLRAARPTDVPIRLTLAADAAPSATSKAAVSPRATCPIQEC